ncbi:MAG: prolyl-tRNA synthetase associated domain-containing protein [Clostridia bacterium]|nr:prolyl-tRNA synthetase associated domain-containing protein [Clostridia bacterium]
MIEIDCTRYEGRPADAEKRRPAELACYDLLDRLGILYSRVDHAPAATIEQCEQVETVLGAKICKNLFLCNRQKTAFYLFLMQGDKVFKTKHLSKQLGTARLSFAEPEDMERLLATSPGSCSILGLMNDKEHAVHLVIDKPVLEQEYFGCHPCINTSTLRVKTADVTQILLPALNILPTVTELPEDEWE